MLEGRSRGGSPKLERSALQAAGYSDSSGRAKSSCEQAPAYYTGMRYSAYRRETVEALHWTKGPHDHRLQSRQLTHCHEAPRWRKGFQARGKRRKRQRMTQRAGGRGPAGPRQQQPVNSTNLVLGWKRQRGTLAERQWLSGGHAAAGAGGLDKAEHPHWGQAARMTSF